MASSSFCSSGQMAPEFQRPRITEIHVRMDCNGCIQKIKKALNGINGIYDLYIDFPQQKVTVIGRADPERIIKAIKRVRKVAEICSHTEVQQPNSQPTELIPEGGAPPPDGGGPPPEGAGLGQEPTYSQPAEPSRPEDAPPVSQGPFGEQPPGPQHSEYPPIQYAPADMQPNQTLYTSNLNDNPRDYGHTHGYGNRSGYASGYSQSYGGQSSNNPGHSYRYEPQQQHDYQKPPEYSGNYEQARPIYRESGYPEQHGPVYYNQQPQPVYHDPPPSQPQYQDMPGRPVYHEPPPQGHYEPPPSQGVYQQQPPQSVYATHNYNMYRPAPTITEYHHVQSPPRYQPHNQTDYYKMDSFQYDNTSNGNDTSIFSDENPNACTIV